MQQNKLNEIRAKTNSNFFKYMVPFFTVTGTINGFKYNPLLLPSVYFSLCEIQKNKSFKSF